MKLCATIFAYLSSILCSGQVDDWSMSRPVKIKDLGRNELLCMKNGNTILFHFEDNKRLLVKVFDSTRMEIASRKDDYHIIYFDAHYELKAVWEINNEAILFFDQDIDGRHVLIRMRFHSRTGKLLEERVVARSKNVNERMRFYPMKFKDEENYAILFCIDNNHPRRSDISLVFFDKDHSGSDEIQLPLDRQKYDALQIIGANICPNGVLVTVALTETLIYGPTSSRGVLTPRSSKDDHILQFFYIPTGAKEPLSAIVNLSTNIFPKKAVYTYNQFSQALNVLLLSDREFVTSSAPLMTDLGTIRQYIFLNIDERNVQNIKMARLVNAKASTYLQQKMGSDKAYHGSPQYFWTDENGVTTVISLTSDKVYDDNYGIFKDQVGITQMDDNGTELWGVVLPLQHFLTVTSSPIYAWQLAGVKALWSKGNYYVIFNDYNANFKNSIAKPGDTVYNYNLTNACYYVLNKKKQVTKHYLFGEPKLNEHKATFINSTSFDEKRDLFASFIQYKSGKDISFRVAWSKLK